MMNRSLLLASVVSMLCSGCFSNNKVEIKGFPDGVWQSNGYGVVLDVEQHQARVYDLAGSYCGVSQSFKEAFSTDIIVTQNNDQNTEVSLSFAIDPHTYQFKPLQSLPETCLTKAQDTPFSNFEAFVSLMQQHYMFFDLYKVDWSKRVEIAQHKINSKMSDAELFEVFTEMLAGIEDSHLGLHAEIAGEQRSYEPDPGAGYLYAKAEASKQNLSQQEANQAFAAEIWRNKIGKELLKGQGKLVANNRIQYGLVGPDLGYLGVVTMGGFTEDEQSPEQELRTLKVVLDNALAELKSAGMKSLILDASFNHGGFDFISREIASRFISEPVLVYSKSPKDAQQSYRTEVILSPSQGERFNGKVYLVVSDMTVSAGEILALSMRPNKHVTVLGEQTRGALSDSLEKTLPNGWTLTLSNEEYLDHQQQFWEGKGIPPQIAIPMFKQADPIKGFSQAMETVIKIAKQARG